MTDEVGSPHEAHALATSTHLDPDGDGEVGLAGADGADEGEVLGVIDEGADGQLPDDGRVDAVAGLEVELRQGLVLRETRLPDAEVDG